jgi:hypothetical protein
MNVLELLMLSGEYIENKEGVVITFSNGKMAKQKHQQYMLLHGILSDGLKEHNLIVRILNETIDDVISFLPESAIEEREFVNALTECVINHVNKTAEEGFEFFNKNYNGDRKEFAINHKNHKLFGHMTMLFRENSIETIEKSIISRMLVDCYRYEAAKTYLRKIGFERELKLLENDD